MDVIFAKLIVQIKRLFASPTARSAFFPVRPVLASATEPVLDRTKVIRQGWCLKESDHLKVWRKRWLVLTRQKLCTFKLDDNSYAQPTASIDMSNVSRACERSANARLQRTFACGARSPEPRH